MEDMTAWIKIAAYVGAAFTIGIGVLGPALSQGKIGATACENLGKYPESANAIQTLCLLAMALVETLALFAFIISLFLITR
jgi:F-type H+-transporting ATPase subunit c